MLHARSHRIFDRTTADLAEAHLRDYARSAQAIGALISAVTVWELIDAGQSCQCQCPSCGLGVCVCLVHGNDTVERTWRETGPPAEAGGVVVLPPRAGSPTAVAGAVADDVVVAVDGAAVETHRQLQSAVQAHEPGQTLRLSLRHGAADQRDIVATRPGPRPTGA
ncbi:MAG: PDZ domain-containing protein [Chloroflexi bacterium]|nr:PDZ domain-containing protein [Chloroflexota bacterium]